VFKHQRAADKCRVEKRRILARHIDRTVEKQHGSEAVSVSFDWHIRITYQELSNRIVATMNAHARHILIQRRGDIMTSHRLVVK